MFPTYPEGWDSCQRADRVTEPHLITKSSFVLSFATTPHPGAVVPRMLGGHRAPTATPGMAKKKGFWCKVSSISPSSLQKKPAWVLPGSIRHEALPAEDTISCTKPSRRTLLASHRGAHALLPSARSRDLQSPGWHGAGLLLPNPIRASQQKAFVLQSWRCTTP